MRKLFDMNNPLMKALSIVADLLFLNVLTLLACLPILTVGPALIALHDIVIRIVRNEEGYLAKPFFQAFAANFKRGLVLSLILLGAGGLLYADYLAATAFIPPLRVGILAIALLVLAWFFYVFALQARYENTLGGTLKNAMLLAVGNFPRTLLMVVCAVGLWVACVTYYQFGVPILVLFGFSLPCYVNILLLNGVFRKLEGEEESEKR